MKTYVILVLFILATLILGIGSVSASTHLWYVTQRAGSNLDYNLYSYDTSTGNITDRGSLNQGMWGDIAMTPSGELYGVSWTGVSGSVLYEISPGDENNSATYSAVSGVVPHYLNALEWDNGIFWSAERNGRTLYRWENVGATWTLSTINGSFDSAGDIEIAPDGTLYAVSDNTSTLYSVNRTTGVPTIIGEVVGAPNTFFGLAFSEDGTMYGFDTLQDFGESALYTIDPSTLQATWVRNLDHEVWGATATSVPVPGAVWLLGSGLIGLARFRDKFKK